MRILVSNRSWVFCNTQKNTSSIAASLKNKLAQLHQGTRQNIPLLGVLPGSLKKINFHNFVYPRVTIRGKECVLVTLKKVLLELLQFSVLAHIGD